MKTLVTITAIFFGLLLFTAATQDADQPNYSLNTPPQHPSQTNYGGGQEYHHYRILSVGNLQSGPLKTQNNGPSSNIVNTAAPAPDPASISSQSNNKQSSSPSAVNPMNPSNQPAESPKSKIPLGTADGLQSNFSTPADSTSNLSSIPSPAATPTPISTPTPTSASNSTASVQPVVNASQRNLTSSGYVAQPKAVYMSYLGNPVRYDGNMSINSTSNANDTKRIDVKLCFAQNKHISCHYKFCFFGWIENYTVTNQKTVKGFPDGKNDVDMLFAFDTNGQDDFVITRDINSTDMFATMVDLACRQFNPAVINSTDWSTEKVDFNQKDKTNTTSGVSQVKLDGLDSSDSTRTNNLTYDGRAGMMSEHEDKTAINLKESTLKNDQNQSTGFEKTCTMVVKKHTDGIPPDVSIVNDVRVRVQQMRLLQGPKCAWNKWRIDHSQEQKAVRDVLSEPNITQTNTTNNISGRHGQINTTSAPIPLAKINLGAAKPGFNELIFFQKQIFTKNCVGKGINLFVIVVVSADRSSGQMRLNITVKYQMFGPYKSLKIYNGLINPGLIVKLGYDFGGGWGFEFIIPLIPPLMGLSINLGIELKLVFHVFILVGASYEVKTGAIIVTGGGGVSTGFVVEVTAALQVLIVEVGIYVSGTLVNLTVSLVVRTKILRVDNKFELSITVTLELRFFAFSWGFFVRFWFFFWSAKLILVNWPIYNGIAWKWLLFKQSFNGMMTRAPS